MWVVTTVVPLSGGCGVWAIDITMLLLYDGLVEHWRNEGKPMIWRVSSQGNVQLKVFRGQRKATACEAST